MRSSCLFQTIIQKNTHIMASYHISQYMAVNGTAAVHVFPVIALHTLQNKRHPIPGLYYKLTKLISLKQLCTYNIGSGQSNLKSAIFCNHFLDWPNVCGFITNYGGQGCLYKIQVSTVCLNKYMMSLISTQYN